MHVQDTISQQKEFQLKKWVYIKNDFLTKEECQSLIHLANTNADQTVTFNMPKQCYHSNYTLDSSPLFFKIKEKIRNAYDDYKAMVNLPQLSATNTLEAPTLLRYDVGTNFFSPHADSWNMSTASRQLSIIVYLNNVEKGGETVFSDGKLNVYPKQGQLLMFPSSFVFTHEGKPPLSESKFIMVTWIHFDGVGHCYRCHPLY